MAKGGRRSGCFEAGGILCGHRARTAFGPIPSVRTDALSRLAEVCRDLWRAECVTKGARPDAASYLSLTVLKTKEQRGKKVVAAEAVRTCGDNLILF